MKKSKSLLSAILSFGLFLLVRAQTQTDFISIDCGLTTDSSYVDVDTALSYVSDASFIDSGVPKTVASEYDTNTLEKQLFTLRTFPEGIRNCYTLKPSRGKDDKYLIRATFLYANYDGLGIVPEFDVYIGPNLWDTVKLNTEASILRMEIIHTPPRNYIDVCLVNTGSGIPFISVLELRLLPNATYEAQSKSLSLVARNNMVAGSNETIRFNKDIYDRIWYPFTFTASKPLNASPLDIDTKGSNVFKPPQAVMATANTPINQSGSVGFYWDAIDATAGYHVFLHFSELQSLQSNETREFNITQNGTLFYGPFVPEHLSSTTIYTTSPISGQRFEFFLIPTVRSTLPPIINAIEIYLVKDFPQSQTVQQDVDAMTNIKSIYKGKSNWVGDPCVPQNFSWDGLNCSYNGFTAPNIISLNLTSSGLTGEITPWIANLTSLQQLDLSYNTLSGQVPEFLSKLTSLKVLDLSNNSLSGPVPEFLSKLTSLTVLNITGNNFNGTIPAGLIQRREDGSLTLSFDTDLCSSTSCQPKKKKNSIVIPIVASIAGVFSLLLVLATLWFFLKRKKQDQKVDAVSTDKNESFELKNRQFSYSDVLRMTNNFERVLGKGGFGTVFHGNLDGTQVAVKMLSPSSVQGYKQFQAEVKLLMRVYHQNLTALVGYCNEGTNMGLIYEYMANGNLEMHLTDNKAAILSWERRLQIALDAAQGLEYLHSGCKPPIVHRDVKSTNILLTENFQAKLADFGLSRTFPVEGGTHVSTVVAGTPGYLDPEYYLSNWLSEKSDIYSFGIVLLEIITNRQVITNTHEKTHISQWVSFMLAKGDIKNVVDSNLHGSYDINSVWKIVELAMACVSPTSTKRPTMNQVVMELKECLAIEMSQRQGGNSYVESKDSIEIITRNFDTEMTPLAR